MKNKEKVNTKPKPKQFRLRGKKLLLTYIQLNVDILKNTEKMVLEQLSKKVPRIIQYVITKKNYKKGNVDYHIYLEFNQKVELYGLDCLNLEFDGIRYCGKYETVRKKDIIIKAMVETNNFIAEPNLHFLDGELYLNFKEFLIKLHQKGKLDEMKNYLDFKNL
jgi:hypothetical protein